jgi:hypothetical protein
MKNVWMATLCLLCGFITACSSSDQTASTATASPSPTVATVVATPTAPPAPSIVKTENKKHPDGSETLITYYSDGSKREVRTFKAGPLMTVERQTKVDGTMTAHVVHRRDNSETEIKDKSWIDKSMDATGDALAKAVSTTKDVGEKVGDTAVKGATATGEAVKEGAEKTGSGAEKGAKEVGKGAKKVGKTVKKAVTN